MHGLAWGLVFTSLSGGMIEYDFKGYGTYENNEILDLSGPTFFESKQRRFTGRAASLTVIRYSLGF